MMKIVFMAMKTHVHFIVYYYYANVDWESTGA